MKVRIATIQWVEDDDGKEMYTVTTRQGSSGEMPPHILAYEGPSPAQAFYLLGRAAAQTILGEQNNAIQKDR